MLRLTVLRGIAAVFAMMAVSFAALPGCVVEAAGADAEDTASVTEETDEVASEMVQGPAYCGTGTYTQPSYKKWTYVTSYPGNPSEHVNEWRVYNVFSYLKAKNQWIYIGQETHPC